jgi:hypothetical protein
MRELGLNFDLLRSVDNLGAVDTPAPSAEKCGSGWDALCAARLDCLDERGEKLGTHSISRKSSLRLDGILEYSIAAD